MKRLSALPRHIFLKEMALEKKKKGKKIIKNGIECIYKKMLKEKINIDQNYSEYTISE